MVMLNYQRVPKSLDPHMAVVMFDEPEHWEKHLERGDCTSGEHSIG